MNEREARVDVRGLSKSYGRVQALADVSFSLHAGEFVGLLGANGAGKSTLVNVLTGLFAADEGELRICGVDAARHPASALGKLGVVFQQPSLDLELSVRQNFLYYGGLRGLTRRKRVAACEAALRRSGLADRASSRARALSGGLRRRAEIARALMDDPDVLLLDEASQGLDPASRRDLVSDVRRMTQERALTVLWATHIVDELEHADRILVLDAGRLRGDATPRALCASTGTTTLEDAFLRLTARACAP